MSKSLCMFSMDTLFPLGIFNLGWFISWTQNTGYRYGEMTIHLLNTVIVVHLLFTYQGPCISQQMYILAYILHISHTVSPEMVSFKS